MCTYGELVEAASKFDPSQEVERQKLDVAIFEVMAKKLMPCAGCSVTPTSYEESGYCACSNKKCMFFEAPCGISQWNDMQSRTIKRLTEAGWTPPPKDTEQTTNMQYFEHMKVKRDKKPPIS